MIPRIEFYRMLLDIPLCLTLIIVTVLANPSLTMVEKLNQAQGLWTAGHNSITDKGPEYMKKLCGAKLSKPQDRLPIKKELKIVIDVPDSFDARKQWPNCTTIDSIKNQGECGSCWAIATTSSISDRLCIATQAKINISSENLLACCCDCSETGGCNGGYPDKAWTYFQLTGLVTGGDYGSNEGCQPYELAPTTNDYTPPCHDYCTNEQYSRPYQEDLYCGVNGYTLPPKNVKAMQTEIMTYGPVEATFDLYEDFYYYEAGIYVHTTDLPVGHHAVRVIGWGQQEGTDYWLVANSWGRDWGINGLFKIIRGTNECRFEEYVLAGLVKS